MKVFVDECVTYDLMPHLTGHQFTHIADTPLRGAKNGAMLRAVAPDHAVFLTTDKSIPYQQNLKKFAMAFIILRAASNDVEDLLPLLPRLTAVLERIEAGGYAPGDLYEIAAK